MSTLGIPGGVGGGSPFDQASRTPPRDRFAEITSEQFVSLILTELSNQDPLEPQDTQALLDQVSTLRAIESDEATLERLDGIITQNGFATAANLIGAIVTGPDENGDERQDLVASVSRVGEDPVLNLLGGGRIRFDDVRDVTAPLGQVSSPAAEAPEEPDASDEPDEDVDGEVSP